MSKGLKGKVALVAGATRGAGRGIAVQLGGAGATVYVTGQTTRSDLSEMNRLETIEETASLVDEAGGRGIAVQVDHLVPDQVRKEFCKNNQSEIRRATLLKCDDTLNKETNGKHEIYGGGSFEWC